MRVRVSLTTTISFALAISACADVIGVQDYQFEGADGGVGVSSSGTSGGVSSGTSGSASGSTISSSGSAIAGSTSGASSGTVTGTTGTATTGATGATTGSATGTAGSVTGSATTGSSAGAAGTATTGTTTGSTTGAKSGSSTGSTTGTAGATTGTTTGSTGTTTGTSSGSGSVQTCSATNPVPQTFNAGLTFYQQTAANNCAVPWPTNGLYVALSTDLYDNPSGSSACGKCVEVTGASNSPQTLFVVDQCPVGSNAAQCSSFHLDLSPTAFTAVQGSQSPGLVNNSPGLAVKFVPCPVTGNIVYSFTTSTSQFYLAMVIENAKYGISAVKYRPAGSGSFTAMPLPSDADPHWVIISNPPNPIDFQVVSEWGQTLEDDNIHFSSGQNVTGAGQFATCP